MATTITLTAPSHGQTNWDGLVNQDLATVETALNDLYAQLAALVGSTDLIFYTGTAWPTAPAVPKIYVSLGYSSAPDPGGADGSVWLKES